MDKILKSASQKVKEFANIMISNDNVFSCMVIDLQLEGNYLEDDIIMNWLHNLYQIELKYKPLPEIALKNMIAKGIQPKKQPIENILITITNNNRFVFVGISIPKEYEHFIDKFVDVLPNYYTLDNCFYSIYEDEFPLKERDNISRIYFNLLKELNLYKEDNDDEIKNYLEEF
jgi:hypothetical protein